MCRLLERDPAARLPAAADCYERGVSLAGMSKAFGMPGIRLGWLASRDRALHATLQRLHDYSTICNSAPAEVRRSVLQTPAHCFALHQCAQPRRDSDHLLALIPSKCFRRVFYVVRTCM